jgi:Holliday junction DNA helicase RuvA
MIAHLQGKLVENTNASCTDCNGLWFNITVHLFAVTPATDSIKLYTYSVTSEDFSHVVWFCRKIRTKFLMLLSVSGIGASIARTMLSLAGFKQILMQIARCVNHSTM